MTSFSFEYIHKYRHGEKSHRMNFHKSSVKMLSLAVLAATMLTAISLQDDAFARQVGMEFTATSTEGSSSITISGFTASTQTDITVKVTAPNGAVVTVDQFSPSSNGSFSTSIQTSSFTQDGTYSILVNQGDTSPYKFMFDVEIMGGMTGETSFIQSSLHETDTQTFEIEANRGLEITADAVEGTTTIGIQGHSDRTFDVTLIVTAPNGNVVTIAQVTPDSQGFFSKDIETGGPLWSQDGHYRITAEQGVGGDQGTNSFKHSVTVEVIDGVIIPEFGTIAAMILAIAIISIIAISSKTRLSIIPRY